jgi:hypothetical protein
MLHSDHGNQAKYNTGWNHTSESDDTHRAVCVVMAPEPESDLTVHHRRVSDPATFVNHVPGSCIDRPVGTAPEGATQTKASMSRGDTDKREHVKE